MKCVSPDYCDGIPGVGPKKAIKLLRQHGSLESYLKAVFKKTTDQTKRANIAFDPNHLLRVRNLVYFTKMGCKLCIQIRLR
mmetsp:Transcript_10515/g.16851  ORF Transcript_10515/g.16851 Transcript_10515/m.16851 type:complete len:81 (+) Transcript_10515:1696-1938(+)